MATPAEIATKHAEFQQAVADLDNANSTYEAAKTPYLASKQALVDAIVRVDALDDELEAMTSDYEPQGPPTPQ